MKFIKISPNTYISTTHISGAALGASYLNLFVSGHSIPFRVTDPDAIEEIRNLIESGYDGVTSAKDPEIQTSETVRKKK